MKSGKRKPTKNIRPARKRKEEAGGLRNARERFSKKEWLLVENSMWGDETKLKKDWETS